ncbi:hypothetical protein ABT224_11570 [Streptomyces sp. NPDC001584]|uniref:hypothetical protein n=1 Tax=Streptomyces sp. NPDC001584 TaxID=3154521 RepID=UPI0033203A62
MQLRLALPLTLAALVTATGCVTVHPAAPPDAPRQARGAAARTQDRQPTPLALPLGPLPASPEPASPVPPAPPEPPAPLEPPAPRVVPEAGPAQAPVPAAAERPRRPRRADARPPRPRRPAEQAKPAAPAKPRKRPPAVAKPRPAPQGSYDMASLCEAAKGTVHPSIVALCQ